MRINPGKIRYGSSFSVSTHRVSEVYCGQYVKKRNVVFQGMRVNCESPTMATNKISLKFIMIPFYLAELEVLSLGM